MSQSAPAGTFVRVLDEVPPASGAVVMGTGIVSIALLLDGVRWLSDVLLVLDAVAWFALVTLLPARAGFDPRRFAGDLSHPTALTSVAGTAVLGTRLTLAGWDRLGGVLLVIAVVVWLGLVPRVLRHWQTPTVGASFIITVATESLALLAATLALSARLSWLLYVSLPVFCLGLGLYAIVLSRFDFRQLTIGIGDHWVTGGALAITTVTAGRIAFASHRIGVLTGAIGAFKVVALVLWGLSLAWLPALVVAELVRPRLAYSVRRWSTVFPVGMYAACSFVVGALTGTGGIVDFARVWVWVAVAVWLAVSLAMARRAPALLAGRVGLRG